MKKNILKIVALALSIGSLGSMQAMDESPPQNYARTAWNCLKNITPYTAGAYLATLSGLVAHEAGHALMASLIQPGCVEEFHINYALVGNHNAGHVMLNNSNMSPEAQMAIYAAGPAVGALFCYAGIKGFQALGEYLKTKSLTLALKRAQETSFVMPTSDSPFMLGIHTGLLGGVAGNALQMQAGNGVDGQKILSLALNGDEDKAIPTQALATWNAALLAVGIGGTAYAIQSITSDSND